MTDKTDDALTADDRAQLAAMTHTEDPRAIARLVLSFYRDLDRAERTPRRVLYIHLGWLAGRLDLLARMTALRSRNGEPRAAVMPPVSGDALTALVAKATEWLEVGGFFNPEMMEKSAAQHLVIELRDALIAAGRSAATTEQVKESYDVYAIAAHPTASAPLPAPTAKEPTHD